MTASCSANGDLFPKSLGDNFWLLGNYYFNQYLIKGDKASALVEVGISSTVEMVIRQLEALHIYPDYIVMTHPHSDHATGLAGLKQRYPDSRVVAGSGAGEFLAHPKAAAALVAEDRHMARMIRDRGFDAGGPPVTAPPLLGDCLIVDDHDEIDIGGLTLRFLDTKGHSPGNITVEIPEIGALMVSDSLGFHYPGRGFLPLFFTGFHDYMASLDRLSAIGAKTLCLAHQGPVTGSDVGKAFRESRRATLELLDRIIENRDDREALAERMFREYYVDEFRMYSENNIRNCCRLLVCRGLEALNSPAPPA